MRKTIDQLQSLKAARVPLVMVTAYDYPTAILEDEAGVDAVLVGDSVGTNILGYESEKQVTLDDMIHHVKAVRRGLQSAYLLGDMPYRSYENPPEALANAQRLIAAGADGVKLEGALPEIVRFLTKHEVEVCAHLGYTPQTADTPEYKAKTAGQALQLIRDARLLEHAGASWIVLEAIPEEVARFATECLRIPVIGIGAGRFVDGQVLVITDLLGLTPTNFRHNKRFAELRGPVRDAITAYASEVRSGSFPAEKNVRAMALSEKSELLELLDNANVAHERLTPIQR